MTKPRSPSNRTETLLPTALRAAFEKGVDAGRAAKDAEWRENIRLLVDIPFAADMQQASLEGRKTATSRTKRYGKVGDTFYIQGVLFEITAVFRRMLQEVYFLDYGSEGFDSPAAFEAKWLQLHPRKGWVPEQMVWFHEYRKA